MLISPMMVDLYTHRKKLSHSTDVDDLIKEYCVLRLWYKRRAVGNKTFVIGENHSYAASEQLAQAIQRHVLGAQEEVRRLYGDDASYWPMRQGLYLTNTWPQVPLVGEMFAWAAELTESDKVKLAMTMARFCAVAKCNALTVMEVDWLRRYAHGDWPIKVQTTDALTAQTVMWMGQDKIDEVDWL